MSITDFTIGESLGEGSYSSVMQVTFTSTGKQFAAKILDKAYLVRKQKMAVALVEKNALLRLAAGHPGIIKLHYTFQDDWSLYFILDLASNGEMQSLLSRVGSLDINSAQFYAAQIIDAVAYMHSKGVIHRDLKPENLLLDDAFRIKITDFGTAKILESDMIVEKFVGTAQYVAPELVESNETSQSSDLWAIGCIIYQMIAGHFAFQGLSEYLTLQKIKQMDYSFPEGFDEQAKNLVSRLLVRDPTHRLGAGAGGSSNDLQALRSHSFFSSVRWETLWSDPVPPLSPGMFKKDPAAGGRRWDDVGAAWDRLALEADDDIEWAPDGEGPTYTQHYHTQDVDIGPLREDGRKQSGSSRSSSSDGSAVEKLASDMQAFSFRSPSPERKSPSRSEYERGRAQATTPIQGNGATIDIRSVLKLPEDELVVYRSEVDVRSLRRQASRLLPIPIPVARPRSRERELILTNRRLFCLKRKSTADITIKSEFFLRPQKTKEKDNRNVISTVELKGECEFAVVTTSKSHHYITSDAQLASTWVQKIDFALNKSTSQDPRT